MIVTGNIPDAKELTANKIHSRIKTRRLSGLNLAVIEFVKRRIILGLASGALV